MLRKTILPLIFILFCAITSLHAQNYTLLGDKTFGTYLHELEVSLIKLDGNHLLVAGTTLANTTGDKTEPICDSLGTGNADIWLLKIDTQLNIIWDKSIGGSKAETTPHILVSTGSNQILLTGTSDSDSSCDKTANNKKFPLTSIDYWICKLDSVGNRISDWTWGGTDTDNYPQSIQLTSGNYIVGGVSKSPISGDKTTANYNPLKNDYWLVKTDILGNKIWDKIYGGTGQENGLGNSQNRFMFLPDSADDNFILAGTTDSPQSGDISDSSRGSLDIWIIKIDSAGNKIWDKRFGGSNLDICNHIMHTSDNGYMICGSTNSPQGGDLTDSAKGLLDFWVLKLDSAGNKQWDKRYGGNKQNDGLWIENAPGGGYWVSGQTNSDSSFDVSENPYGNHDYWIFKIDDNGNKLWDHRFGGPGYNHGAGFVIMPDTSIFLYGYADVGTSAVKTDSGKGLEDYWIVHFKYTDSLSTVGVNNITDFSNGISVFPNPTKDLVTIKSGTDKIKQIELVNLMGETLQTQKINFSNTAQLNLQTYAPGFYFVRITGEKFTVVKRVVRE
jgi:hypothetical protein